MRSTSDVSCGPAIYPIAESQHNPILCKSIDKFKCDLAALVDHEVGECGAGEADDEGEGACESVFAVLGPHAGVGDVCQHVEDGVPVGCGLDVLFALASALHNDIFIYYVLPVSM